MNGNNSTQTIVFDLDDTICFPNHEARDTATKYGDAKPNQEVIDRIRFLNERGFYIIIHSARRMLTHKGNLEQIHNDVWDVTVNWLFKNGVPYNELIFGKPYSNTYYVDDKAMNLSEFNEWTNDELCYWKNR